MSGFGPLSAVYVEATPGDTLHYPVLVVQTHSIVGVHAMASNVSVIVGVIRVTIRSFEFLYDPEVSVCVCVCVCVYVRMCSTRYPHVC